jgi:hypothetical protein
MSFLNSCANQLVSQWQWAGKADWQAEMVNRLAWSAMQHMAMEALEIEGSGSIRLRDDQL